MTITDITAQRRINKNIGVFDVTFHGRRADLTPTYNTNTTTWIEQVIGIVSWCHAWMLEDGVLSLCNTFHGGAQLIKDLEISVCIILREHTTIATAMIASAQSWSELSTTIVPLYVKNLDFLLDYKSIFLFIRVLWNVYYMF